ncbi:MAG: hypothetical protein GY754_45475 [bacterium]|nr:hypothetical protein [bacterium]
MKDRYRVETKRVHIESLFLMARYDSEFKEQLLEDRETALHDSGIPFTPGEVMLLSGIDRGKLEQTIDEFSVPGITQKSLPNWRAAAAVILLLASVLFSGPYCRATGRSGQVESGEEMRTEGWIDGDTYRLSSSSAPPKRFTDIARRKAAAKRAAILNAQYHILEKFKGTRIEGAAGMADYNMTGMAHAQEVVGYVKNGKVIKETYDKEQNCEILYEVKAPKLKRLVNSAEFR